MRPIALGASPFHWHRTHFHEKGRQDAARPVKSQGTGGFQSPMEVNGTGLGPIALGDSSLCCNGIEGVRTIRGMTTALHSIHLPGGPGP